MENPKPSISLQITINASVSDCWTYWTTADTIRRWNFPSDDWHTPYVEIDLQTGGRFLYRMEKKEGGAGFDHAGIYDEVKPFERIVYTGTDGRKSAIHFRAEGEGTVLTETFEPEDKTPIDIQRDFCQGVLCNFRTFAEKKAGNALNDELEKITNEKLPARSLKYALFALGYSLLSSLALYILESNFAIARWVFRSMEVLYFLLEIVSGVYAFLACKNSLKSMQTSKSNRNYIALIIGGFLLLGILRQLIRLFLIFVGPH